MFLVGTTDISLFKFFCIGGAILFSVGIGMMRLDDEVSISRVKVEDSIEQHGTIHNSITTESEKKAIINSGGWLCKQCNKANANYIGTCGCGHDRV